MERGENTNIMLSLIDVLTNNAPKRDIAIFGTGLDAVKCAYSLFNRGISIQYFLNNNSRIETFLGCPVYEPDFKYISDKVYIIVAVGTMSTYLVLSNQLKELHLEEFTDFIYYKWIDKKLVLLHGNCHMTVIKAYLESSQEFSDIYAIYPNPLIQENKEKRIENNVLKNCEIWIHEDIQEQNAYGYFLSDVYIREKWKETGRLNEKREIIVPNLFGLGKGFFPQSRGWSVRNEKIGNAQDAMGMFPYMDIIIDSGVEQKMSVENIIQFCKDSCMLDQDTVITNFEQYMTKIKKREDAWDIKIYDFIQENYRKVKLFFDESHPTNDIFIKICRDILQELGIFEQHIYSDISLDTPEIPIYPVVRHYLKMEWEENEIRKSFNAKKMCSYMDFEEYIREYLWWNYKLS